MKKKQRDKLLFTIFMYLVTLVIFYPMIMMLLVSLKSKAEVVSNPVGVKMSFQFSNYTEAFREMNYPLAFRNSVTLTACSVLAVSFLGCIAAYAIVRCTKMKKLFLIINILFMIGLSLPQQVAIVPRIYCGKCIVCYFSVQRLYKYRPCGAGRSGKNGWGDAV